MVVEVDPVVFVISAVPSSSITSSFITFLFVVVILTCILCDPPFIVVNSIILSSFPFYASLILPVIFA